MFLSNFPFEFQREKSGFLRFFLKSPNTFQNDYLGENAKLAANPRKIRIEAAQRFRLLHFVCPFFSNRAMKTRVRVDFGESPFPRRLASGAEPAPQFYSTLSAEDFLSAAQASPGVLKAPLGRILASEGATTYSLDFRESDKYLLALEAPRAQFKLTCKARLKLWVILQKGSRETLSELKENSEDIMFLFSPAEAPAEEAPTLFFFLERALLAQEGVDLQFFVYVREGGAKGFFDQNWALVVIGLLVVVIVCLLIFFKKRALKRKREAAAKKEEQQKLDELMKKRQEETRRMSLYLKKNLHKLDGGLTRGRYPRANRQTQAPREPGQAHRAHLALLHLQVAGLRLAVAAGKSAYQPAEQSAEPKNAFRAAEAEPPAPGLPDSAKYRAVACAVEGERPAREAQEN